jgi:predicted enzyme involved in methoxymalonyl-ACP biosynthesis
MLGESVLTMNKNTEVLLVASKENGLEVNDEKTEYMVMYREHIAGQNHDIKTGNKSFEIVEHFKYLGTTLTNQNSSHEQIKSRLNSLNAYFQSVQNICLPLCYLKALRLYTEL